VTPADVQAIVFRKRDGGAPSSAAQIRNLLKRMFEYAMANGVITLNPALTIPMRFITQARPRTRTLPPASSESISRRSTNRIFGVSSSWRCTSSCLPWCGNPS
jgi:hypothetical protein